MKRTIGIIECNYSSKAIGQLGSTRPLASLPFHGRYRVVDFALSNMTNADVTVIGMIMPTNYRSIIDHVGAGKEWGLIRKRGGLFIEPGSPFGTARTGGRFLLEDLLKNKAIFTRNDYDYVVFASANVVFTVDYDQVLEAHTQTGADITVLAKTVTPGHADADLINLDVKDGRVTGFSSGVAEGDTAFLDSFIINKEKLFELMDRYETKDYLDLFEAMEGEFDRINVQVFDFNEYVAPVFNLKSFYEVNRELLELDNQRSLFPRGRKVKTKSHDTSPAKYEAGSKVTNSSISSSCIIKGTVEGSVLGRHCIVEPGAVVIDSLLMQGAHVMSGARVENAVIDRNNTIPANTVIQGTKDDIFYLTKAAD